MPPPRYQMRHCEEEHWQSESPSNPKAAGHFCKFGTVILNGRNGFRLQGHAAFWAITRMILLHLRMHWAGIDGFACRGCGPSEILFQSHATFRARARPVGVYAGAHWAKEFGGWGRGGNCNFRVVVGLAARMFPLIPRGCRRWRFFAKWLDLAKEFLATVFAAKIKYLASALNAEAGSFVDRHTANGVSFHFVYIIRLMRRRDASRRRQNIVGVIPYGRASCHTWDNRRGRPEQLQDASGRYIDAHERCFAHVSPYLCSLQSSRCCQPVRELRLRP